MKKISILIILLLIISYFKLGAELLPYLILDSIISGIILIIIGTIIDIYVFDVFNDITYLFLFGFVSYIIYRLLGIHDFFNNYGLDKHIKKKLMYNNPEIYNPAYI